jgi:hypothetical protein
VRRAELEPLLQLVSGRRVSPGEKRAHLVEAGIDEMSGVVDPPLASESAAGRERGPPHEPGGPDVAEHATLVADRVGQPRLLEQLVELRPMLLGHLRAHVGDPAFYV